jgi:tetratricopeptide (TPR) repeat protein
MNNLSMMNRNIIVALLTLVPLICMTSGNISAQDTSATNMGKSAQFVSLEGALPRPNAGSARDAEETPSGAMLSAKTFYDSGVKYLGKKEYDLAISEFNKSLEIYPVSAATYNNRGFAYAKKGRYDLAISDFTKALEIEPNGPQPYYNRGVTYVIKSQFDMALLDLNKCLNIDPINAAAYDARGSVLAGLACSDWGKACQLGNCDHLKEAAKAGLCTKE